MLLVSIYVLLALLHEGSVVLLRHFDTAVAEQQGHAVDRDAFIEQLNRERIAEHVRVAALQGAVRFADIGDSKETSQ